MVTPMLQQLILNGLLAGSTYALIFGRMESKDEGRRINRGQNQDG